MRKIPFILLLMLCLCLCACAVPAQESPAADEDETALVELTVYHGDENCEKLLTETIMVPELTPEYIMSALYTKGVINEEVPVNSFLMDKTGVIRLDLGGKFADLINVMGTSGEYIMMGSLVNSFLDAYDAQGLMLLVDGKTLETGHSIYDFTLKFYE